MGRTVKVKEYPKCHDAKAHGCSKVAMSSTNVFKLLCYLVEYLHVGSKVSISPFLGVASEHLRSDFTDVELMIA